MLNHNSDEINHESFQILNFKIDTYYSTWKSPRYTFPNINLAAKSLIWDKLLKYASQNLWKK